SHSRFLFHLSLSLLSLFSLFFFSMIPLPPTSTLFPYTTLFRSSQFTFQRSIDVLIIVVFGGIGSVTGSFVAAIALGLLNSVLAPLGQLRMVVYGIAIIAIMVFKPSGLMGDFELQFSKLFNRKKKDSDKEEA